MHTKTLPQSSALFRAEEPPAADLVTLQFDDQSICAPAGLSIAAALLLSGVRTFRTTPVSSAPRAPYCMMGVCFDCLVEVDGMPSRQACQIEVRDGMRIRSQEGASDFAMRSQEEENER